MTSKESDSRSSENTDTEPTPQDTRSNRRAISSTRNVLLITAAIQLILGYLYGYGIAGATEQPDLFYESLAVAAALIMLAVWSTSSPFYALLTGLAMLMTHITFTLFFDPARFSAGLFLKIILAIYMIDGLRKVRLHQHGERSHHDVLDDDLISAEE